MCDDHQQNFLTLLGRDEGDCMKGPVSACCFGTGCHMCCSGSGREGLRPSDSGPPAITSRLSQVASQASDDQGSPHEQIQGQASSGVTEDSQSLQETPPVAFQPSHVSAPDKPELCWRSVLQNMPDMPHFVLDIELLQHLQAVQTSSFKLGHV